MSAVSAKKHCLWLNISLSIIVYTRAKSRTSVTSAAQHFLRRETFVDTLVFIPVKRCFTANTVENVTHERVPLPSTSAYTPAKALYV